MSKEIKFRWVGRNKKFDHISINSGLTTSKLLSREFLSFFNESNRGENGNCEFLSEDLFTGLKDKNGVEIYEWDIISYTNSEFDVFIKNIVVEWNFDKTGFNLIPESVKENYSVIGNIYENPELLT